jgi:tight adherence protein C
VAPAAYGLLAVACCLVALRGVVLVRDRAAAERLALDVPGATVAGPPPLTRAVNALGRRLGPSFLQAMGEAQRTRARRRLDLAGRPMALADYAERKAATIALGVLVALLLVLAGGLLVAVPVLVFAFLGLDMSIARRGRLRQDRLERDLPDFLDILAVTVRAGIGYRPALARVAAGLGGPMGEEIGSTLHQMELGASRREALTALGDRNAAPAVQTFVTAQLQAEELGVPLADALNEIARDMRQHAYQSARQRAQRAAPRVSLIITGLIVPASIILVVAALFLTADFRGSGLLGG